MPPTDTIPGEPDNPDIRYDLSGNPLPPRPKAAAPTLVIGPAPLSPAGPAAPLPFHVPEEAVKTFPRPMLYLGLGIGFLLIVGLLFGARALRPKPITVPTVYKTYTALDGSFSCDQPGGWTVHETGANGGTMATAVFEDGDARVRVISDAAGSLMSDTMSANNANLPPAQQVPPVEKLHALDKPQLAGTLPGYKEGDAQKFMSAVGDARISEWTAAGSRHGYRVTMLGNEREYTVICVCSERDWPLLLPAFQRIIRSVKPGSA